jgi:hypothetical protein
LEQDPEVPAPQAPTEPRAEPMAVAAGKETSPPKKPGATVTTSSCRPRIDLVAAVAAGVAACALGVSLYEAYTNRKHERLAILPYVTFTSQYDEKGAYLDVDNWGLGPAVVGWFQVLVDDKPRSTWREVLTAVGMDKTVEFHGSVLSRGLMMVPSTLANPSPPLLAVCGAPKEILKRQERRITLKVCYCSLYAECWTASSSDMVPRAVTSCEARPRETFVWENRREQVQYSSDCRPIIPHEQPATSP